MILHILPSLETGGAERYVVEILKYLKSKDIDAELLLFDRTKRPMLKELEESGIKVNFTFFQGYLNVFNALYFIYLFRKKKYRVIHAHLTYPQLWCAVCSFMCPDTTSMFTTEHSNENNRRNHSILKSVDRFIYKRFKKIFCISQTTRNSLMTWLGTSNLERFPIVPNGVNIYKFRDAKAIRRTDLGLGERDKIIMMVGRLSQAKDQLTLIRAMSFLSEEYKLLLVGDGINKDSLVEACNKDNRIVFLGDRTDIPGLLKCCDIYVQSSHWEGLPTTVLEAMAAGKVVIGSNVKGNEDIIPKEQLFEYNNDKQLSIMIMGIVNSKDNLRIERQYELLKNYALERIVENMLRDYRK